MIKETKKAIVTGKMTIFTNAIGRTTTGYFLVVRMDTGSVAIDTAVVRISVDVLAGKITGDFSSISFQR